MKVTGNNKDTSLLRNLSIFWTLQIGKLFFFITDILDK